MPVFEVEQYELHAVTYRIEAADRAEAVMKLLSGDGDADMVDNSQEYIEIPEDYGMIDEELAKQLHERYCNPELLDDGRIPSIRAVLQVE